MPRLLKARSSLIAAFEAVVLSCDGNGAYSLNFVSCDKSVVRDMPERSPSNTTTLPHLFVSRHPTGASAGQGRARRAREVVALTGRTERRFIIATARQQRSQTMATSGFPLRPPVPKPEPNTSPSR
jgi:hypothetical protein